MRSFGLSFLLVLLAFVSLPYSVLAFTADNYYNAGSQLYQKGQYDQAIQYCQAAVQINPGDWQAYQLMGYCYYSQKNNLQALQALDHSLQINPNNPALQTFDNQLRASAPSTPPDNNSPNSSAPPLTTSSSASYESSGESFNPNLPIPGRFSWEWSLSAWMVGYKDINDLYGSTVANDETPVGEDLHLGTDFTISPNFQLGLCVDFILKPGIYLNINSYAENDNWQENAFGGGLDGKMILPLSDGINFVGTAEVGFYSLVDSSYTAGNDYASENFPLSASGLGAQIGAAVELVMDPHKLWALDLGLSYRLLSFSPVTLNSIVVGQPSLTLKQSNGSNASIDFSGPQITLTARYF